MKKKANKKDIKKNENDNVNMKAIKQKEQKRTNEWRTE